MKMASSRGLKCFSNFNKSFIYLIWYLSLCMFSLNNSHTCVYAKSLDQRQLQQQQQKDHQQNSASATCDNVRELFESINVTNNRNYHNAGDTCGGHCCDNRTEDELLAKSTLNFERLIRDHTNTQRDAWEAAAAVFRDHVLELSRQSENKTLNLFAQVYRRMSPSSRQPILDLYQSIRNHISSPNYEDNLETVVDNFFMELFPVAYHNAVQAESKRDGVSSLSANTEFNNDFKNCLMHTYESLQPFGDTPRNLAKSIVQSVSAATVFVRALDQGAEILEGVEKLGTDSLTDSCRSSLLKMNYCARCKGHLHAKPCYTYCVNVMNGCITQHIGNLNQDWLSFSEIIEKLLVLVRSQDGIETVIKGMDTKLSDAIMYAMANGPQLDKKVKKACGIGESALVNVARENNTYDHTKSYHISKWMSPPDTQMLQFLVTLSKSKDFFYKITNSVCEDDDFQKLDSNCWTGDHFGDYSHTLISPNLRKYNPEVPVTNIDQPRGSKLYILINKLISLKNSVSKPLTMHSIKLDKDQMLADMAEEGSGSHYYNEEDHFSDTETEYEEGSGSGDGMGGTQQPPVIRVNSSNWTPTTSGGTRISTSNPNYSLLGLFATTITLSTLFLMPFASRH